MKSIKMMMAAILLCGAMSAQAQDYYETKHEFGIAIGGGSNSQILNGMEQFAKVIVTTMGTLGTVKPSYENTSEIPTISLDYYYHLTKGVAVGGIFVINGRTEDMLVNKEKIGEAKRYTFTLMPAVKFDWLRKKYFGMYSKFGLGVSMLSDSQKAVNNHQINGAQKQSETRWYVNFQASLLGAEVGSEHIRGFAELGYGEQGIGLIGLRYKF